MSLLGKLFGSEKAVGAIASGIDASILTEQEKRELHIKTLDAYAPFKLTQRILATIVVGTFVLCHFICFVIDVWRVAYLGIERLMQEMMALNNEVLGLPSIVILGFYFAGGAAESWKRFTK